jgi:hypothetical protein
MPVFCQERSVYKRRIHLSQTFAVGYGSGFST